MALVANGICLLLVALTGADAMFCDGLNTNIPWIPDDGLNVLNPVYTGVFAECCKAGYNPDFDPEPYCHLCYNLTKSTPGFTADAHNCNRFYMCEPNGEGGWNTFHMTCPNCTFWDQDLLTCVQVWDHSPECVQTAVTDNVTVVTPEEDPLMFCIDFEDDDLVSDSVGVYRPWILNDRVTIVDNAMGANCPQGQRCGFFNESVLEVPFFSNNYVHWPSMRITLSYRMTHATNMDQGIISNDCFQGNANADGNSLHCSANSADFQCGLVGKDFPTDIPRVEGEYTLTNKPHPMDPLVFVAVTSAFNVWQDVEMNWDGTTMQLIGVTTNAAPFSGSIRNSHCPLMIGAFIKDRIPSYFQGYMDNICFYKW